MTIAVAEALLDSRFQEEEDFKAALMTEKLITLAQSITGKSLLNLSGN